MQHFGYCLVVLAAFFAGSANPSGYFETQAVERGYALYCPDNGRFAWKGECD